MKKINNFKRQVRAGLRKVRRDLARTLSGLSEAWHRHLVRINHDVGYVNDLMSVVLGLVDLLFGGGYAHHVARQVLLIYIAVVRMFAPPEDGFPDEFWGDPASS